MPTEAPARTHCPNCGAKLHRQDLSLCAYCATPLTLGGRVEITGDETAQRLSRLRAHAAFASAMDFSPRDPALERTADRLEGRAWLVLIFAALALAAASIRGGSLRSAGWPGLLAGVAAAAAGALIVWTGLARRRSRNLPVLRRPALVVNRRSLTADKGGTGATVYFFLLHFDDASEGEFRWPGQGTLYEPMPNGTTGVAYTRGERLLEFRKL